MLGWMLAALPPAVGADVCTDCNVLWIVVDTTRADRLGHYGYQDAMTPNLDALARRGTTYRHAYSQAPSTMLSVSSFMSGRYRLDTGMEFTMNQRHERFHQMSDQVTTVAEVVSAAGWETRGVIANNIIQRDARFDLNLHQGFETWELADDQGVSDRGVELLDELKSERFLLYLHWFGPHTPNHRLEGFESRRGLHDISLGDTPDEDLYRAISLGERVLTPAQQSYVSALYDDAVYEVDARVGVVLDRLDELGLSEKTLVVFTSDHGESLGDFADANPRWGHSFGLIDQLLRVPLVVAGPGLPAGKVSQDHVVELVDLAPSLCGYLGIPVSPTWEWDGTAFLGAGAAFGTTALADRGGVGYEQTGARTPTHAVLYNKKNERWKSFDLTVPKGQEHGVTADKQHAELRRLIEAYMQASEPPTEQGADLAAPDGDLLEELQALGYVQ